MISEIVREEFRLTRGGGVVALKMIVLESSMAREDISAERRVSKETGIWEFCKCKMHYNLSVKQREMLSGARGKMNVGRTL